MATRQHPDENCVETIRFHQSVKSRLSTLANIEINARFTILTKKIEASNLQQHENHCRKDGRLYFFKTSIAARKNVSIIFPHVLTQPLYS